MQKRLRMPIIEHLKRISQNVNIAGFRKGKAPKNIVEKYVGTERIKAEAIENLFPKAFSDVTTEHKLDLASAAIY